MSVCCVLSKLVELGIIKTGQMSSVKDLDCKVYLWPRWFYLGHIALELPNKEYISFWPRPKGRKARFVASGTHYVEFKMEKGDNGGPSLTLNVPDLDVEKIFTWWNKISDDEPRWSLTSFNCATVVFEALCEGSDWFKGKGGIFPQTPRGVANIVQKYIDEKKPRVDESESWCVIL